MVSVISGYLQGSFEKAAARASLFVYGNIPVRIYNWLFSGKFAINFNKHEISQKKLLPSNFRMIVSASLAPKNA